MSDKYKNAICIDHLEMEMHRHRMTLPRGLVKIPTIPVCFSPTTIPPPLACAHKPKGRDGASHNLMPPFSSCLPSPFLVMAIKISFIVFVIMLNMFMINGIYFPQIKIFEVCKVIGSTSKSFKTRLNMTYSLFYALTFYKVRDALILW